MGQASALLRQRLEWVLVNEGGLMKLSIAYKVLGLVVGLTLSGGVLADNSGELTVNEILSRTPTAERLPRAAKMIRSMRLSQDTIASLLEQTRTKDRDPAKINCINEKLISIKGFVKVSEASYTDLDVATSRGDEEAGRHYYMLVVISDQKVRQLSSDAQLCVGQVSSLENSAERYVSVSPDIADFRPVGEGGQIATEPDNPLDGIEALDRLPELTPIQ